MSPLCKMFTKHQSLAQSHQEFVSTIYLLNLKSFPFHILYSQRISSSFSIHLLHHAPHIYIAPGLVYCSHICHLFPFSKIGFQSFNIHDGTFIQKFQVCILESTHVLFTPWSLGIFRNISMKHFNCHLSKAFRCICTFERNNQGSYFFKHTNDQSLQDQSSPNFTSSFSSQSV